MAANFVQGPPDSTGKQLQTYMNVIGGNSVHAEAVVIVDTNGNAVGGQLTPGLTIATTNGNIPAGAKSVSIIPSQDFSGTVMGNNYPNSLPIFEWKAEWPYTLSQTNYTISSGTLYIVTLTP